MPSFGQLPVVVVFFACFTMAHDDHRILHFPAAGSTKNAGGGTGDCAAAVAMSFPVLLSRKCRNLRQGLLCESRSGACLGGLLSLRGGGGGGGAGSTKRVQNNNKGAANEEAEILDPEEQVYQDYVKSRQEDADIQDDRQDFEDLLQVVQHAVVLIRCLC
jgi:hypothetical protein